MQHFNNAVLFALALNILTTFRATFSAFCIAETFTTAEALKFKQCIVEMAWAAERPANKPLTGLFTGPLTARFYLNLLITRPSTLFEIPLSLINLIKGS